EGEDAECIFARSLPGLGAWKKYTPEQIMKITKEHVFRKPEPMLSEHTTPTKSWTMPTPHKDVNESYIKSQEDTI
ncbi:34238_t:CDS:2, partial [Racocetra persica]